MAYNDSDRDHSTRVAGGVGVGGHAAVDDDDDDDQQDEHPGERQRQR